MLQELSSSYVINILIFLCSMILGHTQNVLSKFDPPFEISCIGKNLKHFHCNINIYKYYIFILNLVFKMKF